MFRLLRPLHRLIPTGRLAARTASRQIVQIERVKVTKGRRVSKIIGTVVGGVTIASLLLIAPKYIAISFGDDEEEEDEDEDGDYDDDDEDEEDDDDEDEEEVEEGGVQPIGGLFIPFPLTTKQLPPEPYAGSSPEWQEFRRISQDRQARNMIRRQIVEFVFRGLAGHQVLIDRFGEPKHIAQVWLDLHYPYRAPPEYERSGILVTNDFVAVATVGCDQATAQRLRRVLWPEPLALGFWTMGREVAKQTATNCARFFGFASEGPLGAQAGSNMKHTAPPPESRSSEVMKAIESIRQQATRRPEEVKDPSSMSSPAAGPAQSQAAPNKALSVPSKPAVQPVQRSNQDAPVQQSLPEPIQKAVQAYRRALLPMRPDPPRGCVHVSGLVKVETQRGYVTISVSAWYNPKTKTYDPASAFLAMHRWDTKNQRPLQN